MTFPEEPPEAPITEPPEAPPSGWSADAPEIVRLANAILLRAIRQEADSVLIEPAAEGLLVGFRAEDGQLRLEPPLPAELAPALLGQFKLRLGLNPELRPRIQTRELIVRQRRRAFVFSFSFMPLRQGEALGIVVRETGRRSFGQPPAAEARAANWRPFKQAFTRFRR